MLDRETVEKIAQDYYPVKYLDTLLFSDEFRGPIVRNGYLEKQDLLDIVQWKVAQFAERARALAERNDAEDVRLWTSSAFAAPNARSAVGLLTVLEGVGVPVASAILTVYDPEEYTIIDVRVWQTLRRMGLEKLGLSPDMKPDRLATYAPYLEVCKRLAACYGVSLRDLDKCLWVLKGETPEDFLRRQR